MSAKRALHLEDKENASPLKMPTRERLFSPHTGTRPMSPAPAPNGNYKASGEAARARKATKTAIQKKLEVLSLGVEKSARSILKVSQDLESLLPLEGDSELKMLFPILPVGDLLMELKRHKELVAKVESCFAMGMMDRPSHSTGFSHPGNSREMAKTVLR